MYAPGDVVGGWALLERIGQGGMGEVWRAERDGELAAVKVLFSRPDRHEAASKRFEREVGAAARIGHPGIATVLSYGTDGERGSMYLVMELLEGGSLRSFMSQREAALDTVETIRALLEPLAAAHALDPPIVHRDLKPENVFVTDDGAVKLLDFGIARQSGAGTDVTDTGAGLGTAAYMSPEQATDAREVGPAADVWSVGVMLYEAIGGRLPFDAPSRNEIITKILTRAPVPLRDVVPAVPTELARLVDRCLAKEAERRPADARALADALDGVLPRARAALSSPRPRAEVTEAPTPLHLERWQGERRPRRSFGATLLLGSPLLALAGVGAWVLLSAPPRPPAIEPPAPPDAAVEAPPELANPFVTIEPSPATRLGVDDDALDEGYTGFRPGADQRGASERFSLQRDEVTWGELDPWLRATGHESPMREPPPWLPEEGRDAFPATGVPWNVARAYCRSLDADLPTEAQWELAARGPARRAAPSEGLSIDEPSLVPVGTRPGDVTPEGLRDMAANAREWTRDVYRADADGTVAAWADAEERSYRAVRGLPVFTRSRFSPPPGVPLAHRVPLCATGDCPEGTAEILLEVGFRCAR
ncbi:MAG: protein kinase [Sandaracinaceae bacterium]|nr:protein kinase [Sandaracinaceae bacterium]